MAPVGGPIVSDPVVTVRTSALLITTDGVVVTWPGDGPLDEALTEDDAEAHVHGICFKTGPPRHLGVELEWLVRYRSDPSLPVPAERCRPEASSPLSPAASSN
jgi:hypothetical protein